MDLILGGQCPPKENIGGAAAPPCSYSPENIVEFLLTHGGLYYELIHFVISVR